MLFRSGLKYADTLPLTLRLHSLFKHPNTKTVMAWGFLRGEGKRRKSRKEAAAEPDSYSQPPADTPAASYSIPTAPNGQRVKYGTPPKLPSRPYLEPMAAQDPQRSRASLRETLAAHAGRSVTHLRTKSSQYLDRNKTSMEPNTRPIPYSRPPNSAPSLHSGNSTAPHTQQRQHGTQPHLPSRPYLEPMASDPQRSRGKIGRASCRERVF